MTASVKILAAEPVTHNVRRYTLEKPPGYHFTPGEATELSIDAEGLCEDKHPFTFTALDSAETLEFTIKSYFDHDGMTKKLWDLVPGDKLVLRDPWGTIHYDGPGVFLAGGAGVTPFIAILRQLQHDDGLAGNTLIVSNRTEKDIILRQEFEAMKGLEVIWTVTGDPASELRHERIGKDFLKTEIADFSRNFYLCGPDPMVSELRATLKELGASSESVTFEK